MRLFVNDGITEDSELLDFDFDHVAGFQKDRRLTGKADAGRGARRNNVTWHEIENVRRVADQPRDRKDQKRGIGGLHRGAVDPRLQLELGGTRPLVCGHQPRAKWSGSDKVLAGGDLLRVPLIVADADVV